eukprot:gene24511-30865_t
MKFDLTVATKSVGPSLSRVDDLNDATPGGSVRANYGQIGTPKSLVHTPIGSVNGSINNQQQNSTYGSSPPAVSNILNQNTSSPRAYLSAQDLLPPKQQRSPLAANQDPYVPQNAGYDEYNNDQFNNYNNPAQQYGGYQQQQLPPAQVPSYYGQQNSLLQPPPQHSPLQQQIQQQTYGTLGAMNPLNGQFNTGVGGVGLGQQQGGLGVGGMGLGRGGPQQPMHMTPNYMFDQSTGGGAYNRLTASIGVGAQGGGTYTGNGSINAMRGGMGVGGSQFGGNNGGYQQQQQMGYANNNNNGMVNGSYQPAFYNQGAQSGGGIRHNFGGGGQLPGAYNNNQRGGPQNRYNQGRQYPQGNNMLFNSNVDVGSAIVYLVQLKTLTRYHMMDPQQQQQQLPLGEFVIIDADRGEDCGIVVEAISMMEFIEKQHNKTAFNDDENNVGRILRVASKYERQLLPGKYHDEQQIVEVTKQICRANYGTNMTVVDAEYQFDRNKLTIYYDSTIRIDFRELVRDLFAAYKTRIWVKKYNVRHFYPKQYAIMALATGVQFNPDN